MSTSALRATHLCTLLLVLVKGLSFTHVLMVDRFVMHCIICKACAKAARLTPCYHDDSRVWQFCSSQGHVHITYDKRAM